MTPRIGFIRSKEEIKYLILYIAERLIAPVPFDVIQEITMDDPAVDYFEFAECMSYLVQSGHLNCSASDLYSITEKGIRNGRACASAIPYSVRLKVEKLAEDQNKAIRRAMQVQSKVTKHVGGTYGVELRFNDDYGLTLWRMELTVPDEASAVSLAQRFEKEPEKMYNQLIHLLYPSDSDAGKTEEG